MKNLFVISLGGSLVVPDEIDAGYLKKFISFIKANTAQNRFVIVVGGGRTCRKYQNALKEVAGAGVNAMDWMGIYTTRVNARLIQLALGKMAYAEIVKNPIKKIVFSTPVLVAGGYKPGWTTDYVAVLLAKLYGAKRVINLTDVDYVYDKDPKKHKDAILFSKLNWKQYSAIMGRKHTPGAHSLFDPKAAELAQKSGVEVVIVNGLILRNFQRLLKGLRFKGTIIK